MGRGFGYIAGYIVPMQDLDHFIQTNQLKTTDFPADKLYRINRWIRAQNATPPIPILTCITVDNEPTGLVLTNHFPVFPKNSKAQETEWDQGLRARFAAAGDLEKQLSTWQFTVVPNK